MSSTTYSVRVDNAVKDEASKVAAFYGFDLASVTRAFWSQMARTKSIPLTLSSEEPNAESLAAIQETEDLIAQHRAGKRAGYDDANAMFAALGI